MVRIADNEGNTMALVKAQCTKCGAILDVDEKNDADICPICGVPYIVENAIHQYKSGNIGTNAGNTATGFNTRSYADTVYQAGLDTSKPSSALATAEVAPVSTEQFKTVVKDPEAEKQKDLKLFLGVMIPVVIVVMMAMIILLKAYY